MGKDELIADRYTLLDEINKISEKLTDNRYDRHLNTELETLAKQVRSLTTAIKAY